VAIYTKLSPHLLHRAAILLLAPGCVSGPQLAKFAAASNRFETRSDLSTCALVVGMTMLVRRSTPAANRGFDATAKTTAEH